MNIKNTALAIALLATSVEGFVSNPVSGGYPLSSSVAFGVRPSHTRRWASTNKMLSPTPNTEVERLQAMAAKLRQEAAGVEEKQKKAMAQTAEKIFQKFDMDKNGVISAKELQAGLKRLFKMELPEQRTDQLVQEFDINGDGSLQLEEFVRVDVFRNALDTLRRQERDLARQQAKDARAQALIA